MNSGDTAWLITSSAPVLLMTPVLFFGFYPAWQASRLNPIEAPRHE